MLLVWLISALILGEAIGTREILGALTILAGIACIQRTFHPRELLHSGAYAAYACAACITGYHLCYGIAVRDSDECGRGYISRVQQRKGS
jgi:drug/metabolite transporter (DMT)-like permease